jgi:hypothetical protein
MGSFHKVLSAVLLAAALSACAAVEHKPLPAGDVRQNIADAYGIQSFEQVSKIRFSFNMEEDGKVTTRRWIWEPKTDRVLYQGLASQLNPTVYSRSRLDADPSWRLRKLDQWFAHDSYWLLLPFHLVWDSRATVEAAGRQSLPIGWGRAWVVTVTYPSAGKHMPGDECQLFVDGNYRLLEWVCRRDGTDQPTRVSTWEDHRQVGPITIAMTHKGKGDGFRLWFSDVAVQLEGDEEWVAAP